MGNVNAIGQTINVGDRVVYTYYNGTWTPLVGKFLGLTYGNQSRIAVENEKDQKVRRKWTDRVYSFDNPRCWWRVPFTHYVHKATGALLPNEKYWKLPTYDQNNWEWDKQGWLREGYEVIEVPAIRVGPAGLKRTFKIEG